MFGNCTDATSATTDAVSTDGTTDDNSETEVSTDDLTPNASPTDDLTTGAVSTTEIIMTTSDAANYSTTSHATTNFSDDSEPSPSAAEPLSSVQPIAPPHRSPTPTASTPLASTATTTSNTAQAAVAVTVVSIGPVAGLVGGSLSVANALQRIAVCRGKARAIDDGWDWGNATKTNDDGDDGQDEEEDFSPLVFPLGFLFSGVDFGRRSTLRSGVAAFTNVFLVPLIAYALITAGLTLRGLFRRVAGPPSPGPLPVWLQLCPPSLLLVPLGTFAEGTAFCIGVALFRNIGDDAEDERATIALGSLAAVGLLGAVGFYLWALLCRIPRRSLSLTPCGPLLDAPSPSASSWTLACIGATITRAAAKATHPFAEWTATAPVEKKVTDTADSVVAKVGSDPRANALAKSHAVDVEENRQEADASSASASIAAFLAAHGDRLIGGKRFYCCGLAALACSVVVGAAEAISDRHCEARAVLAVAAAVAQVAANVVALTPLDVAVEAAMGLCTVAMGVTTLVIVFEEEREQTIVFAGVNNTTTEGGKYALSLAVTDTSATEAMAILTIVTNAVAIVCAVVPILCTAILFIAKKKAVATADDNSDSNALGSLSGAASQPPVKKDPSFAATTEAATVPFDDATTEPSPVVTISGDQPTSCEAAGAGARSPREAAYSSPAALLGICAADDEAAAGVADCAIVGVSLQQQRRRTEAHHPAFVLAVFEERSM